MAKFTNKDLRLKDEQKVTWGTDLDANMWYDGTADQLRVDVTISGVDPTQDYHLTTKYYVDNEIGNLTIPVNHADLGLLGADDHTQYVPTTGARGFTSTVSGVTPVQDYHLATKWYIDNELATLSGGIVQSHSSLTGLSADDHTQYILVNGTRAFTSTVGGVTPTADAHLTTKLYVDGEISTVSGAINSHIGDATIHFTEASIDHGSISGLDDDDHTQYILVSGTRAFTGTVGGVTPTLDAHLTTKQYVDALVQGLTWLEPVLDIVPAASGIAVTGNRYIASETGGGWTEDYIYEYNGASWDGTAPVDGSAVWVEDLDYLTVYNGTDWVRFGSTVMHNNLGGLQGGAADEYYHLTSTQHSALTDAGGVADASTQHIHDDRYYTETEIDGMIITDHGGLTGLGDDDHPQYAKQTVVSGHINDSTIHFTEASIDHGSIDGLGDDDHTQYVPTDASRGFTSTVSGIDPTQDYHLSTKNYVDTEIGNLTIPVNHADLGLLGADDHTQYILVDGSRGFTATVSGVTPVLDNDLATKAYVDSADQPQNHGREAIADAASTVSVTFAAALSNTNYTVNATMENTSDSPPSIYAFIVSAKTTAGFTVTFMGDMDSANYVLNWSVIED